MSLASAVAAARRAREPLTSSSRPSRARAASRTRDVAGCARGTSWGRARATSTRASKEARAAPEPPDGYLTFSVERTIALVVRDARDGGEEASVRAWLREPGNFIELVFGVADARERRARGKRGGRMFDVAVRPRELLKWEIAPEFAIEAIPGDASESRVDGRARLVGEELRFAGDREKLPPGFANMGVWAHIDARVGIDEAGSGETETRVETEVRVRIAADVPRLLRVIPGFSRAATMTIGTSIDIVRGGISEATQRTYDAWAARRGATTAAGIEKKT